MDPKCNKLALRLLGRLHATPVTKAPAARPSVPLPPAVHVVEDDEDVRVATARVLTLAGYTVQTYASDSEFLTRMQTANPGCVVLDVQLPGQSGLELQEIIVISRITQDQQH